MKRLVLSILSVVMIMFVTSTAMAFNHYTQPSNAQCQQKLDGHSGKSYTQTTSNLFPVKMTNACLTGTKITGTINPNETWWHLKQCCNGAGIMTNQNSWIYGDQMSNIAVDGIRIRRSSTSYIQAVHEVNTRDDCIDNIDHSDLVVNDSLFDGCHTGISWRGNGGSFDLQVYNSLFYVKPMPGSKSGGSCTQWVINGLANGPMWKMDKFNGPVLVKNTIIRQDYGNHECKDVWPTGTYQNVRFVWTSAKPYPGTLPAGVVMSHNVNDWNTARANWLNHHPGL